MTYQVLARKWRPRTFSELVGQKPVLKALTKALDKGRLHHAYLFTGTRGVGKTTLARIMAKALNCEKGVSAAPCLDCQICRDIDSGCFVDLIEIDAASRTKVEDTREILDNVQYRPNMGRYKIYLIDEVHMLSAHSFNALLKTLEEPPSYVVFILATTDPHKIPVTVLSRCLQFTLKHLTPEEVCQQLEAVCLDEQITFDKNGLMLLAKAANGSMRDGLSLLDQAIAYSDQAIEESTISDMLGFVGEEKITVLLDALVKDDGVKLMSVAKTFSEEGIDLKHVLDNVVDALHKISMMQCIPELKQEHRTLASYVDLLSKEEVQLLYDIALRGRDDLVISTSYLVGFEMTLLRMLAFKLPSVSEKENNKPELFVPPTKSSDDKPTQTASVAAPESNKPINEVTSSLTTKKVVSQRNNQETVGDEDWKNMLDSLSLGGMGQTVLSHCCFIGKSDTQVRLGIEPAYQAMMTPSIKSRIENALSEYYSAAIKLVVETAGASKQQTPAQIKTKQANQALQKTKEALNQDPVLKDIVNQFDGILDEESIKQKD